MDTPEDDVERWPEWIATWVLPYLREPVLWPVLIAILGHVVVLFAFGLLGVIRGEGWVSMFLSLAFTGGFAGWELKVMRRPGPVAVWLGLTWAAAAGLTKLALDTGFL